MMNETTGKALRFVFRNIRQNERNIGLQFLENGLSISHEIRRFHVKSGGFHVKSTQNLIKANVSTKTIQFDECRRGAMTLDFMCLHPLPQTEEFLLKHLIL